VAQICCKKHTKNLAAASVNQNRKLRMTMEKTGKIMERSDEFFNLANALSEYIALLGLDKTINDELVNNVMRLIEQAEKDSYRQGIEEGLKYNFDQIMNQIEIESQNIPHGIIH
jgi:hypothetical protein